VGMKIRGVLRLIESDGWRFVRQTGSHRIFHHPTKPGIVIVAGKPSQDLAPGTLNAILKEARSERKTQMKYAVVIEKTSTGYSGYVPDLPGIGVAGETRPKVRRLLKEAVAIYISEKRARGTQPPRSTTVAEYVNAA
jgi:predicted RNA binding protein YcfA (HicA-like mRNA interferase family)/predicted RNase H-like HicB family nuclease